MEEIETPMPKDEPLSFSEDLEDQRAEEEDAEQAGLVCLFATVRKQSNKGELVTPTDWISWDIIPDHMSEEDFEMFVYSYLEQRRVQGEQETKSEKSTSSYRTATRAVGVPQMFTVKSNGEGESELDSANEKPLDGEGYSTTEAELSHEAFDTDLSSNAVTADDAAAKAADALGFTIPEGFELVELEGEWTLIPLEKEEESDALACDDITMLMGKNNYYLYSRGAMTDPYAHWVFLAREDDRVTTFVDCVRSESRIYPRPMAASSFKNEPFCMTDREIDEVFFALSESGEHSDIETTIASNGEVFYFSNTYLSPVYAASLAEWQAVERDSYL